MKDFVYLKPGSLEDAVSVLKKYDDAYPLAGGTDLLVGMKNKTITPQYIVDLKGIPLRESIEYRDGFKINALTPIRDIELSESIQHRIPMLAKAAASLGSVQIRNRATLGGNLCNASPAADMSVALLAMDCSVKITSIIEEKTIRLDEFFTGPGMTILEKDEMLLEVIIPSEVERCTGTYIKLGTRNGMEIGIVNIAVLLDADYGSGLCKDVKISLGAVAPTVIRAVNAENVLVGKTLTPELIDKAAETAAEETKPISDVRASAAYRKKMVKTLVSRGIKEILEAHKV